MAKRLLKGDREWHACRQSVITATEAPIILGLNPYTTPSKLASEKALRTFNGNAYTYVGNLLEPCVAQAVNQRLGTNFQIIENTIGKTFYEHDEIPLGATPDAIDGNRFLECKTTKPLNFLKYKYSPPDYYVMQLQTQLYCAGFEEGYLAIMSTDLSIPKEYSQLSESEYLNQQFPLTVFKVTRCDQLCSLLKQEVIRFWDCKLKNKLFRVNGNVKREACFLVKICYGVV